MNTKRCIRYAFYKNITNTFNNFKNSDIYYDFNKLAYFICENKINLVTSIMFLTNNLTIKIFIPKYLNLLKVVQPFFIFSL